MTSVAFCGCPSAHTGRLWLSVCVRVCLWVSASIHRIFVAVCGCLSAQTGRPCVSVSTHKTSHTQDVRGCPSIHISAHWSLDSSRWPFPWTVRVILAHVVCLFSTHRTAAGVHQHTQDVRGCSSVHTGHSWLSVCVCVCPCVSVRTHMTSVAVHQYTYQHVGRWTQHANPSRGLFGTHRTSVGVRQHTQDIRGCPCVSVSTHRTSVADVCGCPCVSVCDRQHTQDVRVCPSVHISARWFLDSARWPIPWTVWVILAHRTQDVRGCPSAHTGRLWLSVTHRTSVCVCVCLSAHTGRPWLSISTHISTLVLGLSTLALPVDCSGDFGPRGLFVQYTQDVRGCSPVHKGRLWLSISTHRTSVAFRVCPCVS
ncbi:unnamed protein product, partial [Brassica rapa]